MVSSDLLNVLPSSVKNLNNLVTLTPGFRGNEGFDVTGGYTGQVGGTYHGKAGTKVTFRRHEYPARAWKPGLQPEPGDGAGNGALDERDLGADTNADGVQINMVPKEGGNIFTGSVTGLYLGRGICRVTT